MKDQNGRPVRRNVARAPDGTWGANVWEVIGAWSDYTYAKAMRRYFYPTRKLARAADISDPCYQGTGFIRSGPYLP